MKINLKKKSHVKGYALRGAGLRKQVTLQCMLQVFFFYSSNGCYTSSLKRKKNYTIQTWLMCCCDYGACRCTCRSSSLKGNASAAAEDLLAGDGEAGSGARSVARGTPATSVARLATGPSTARDEVRQQDGTQTHAE